MGINFNCKTKAKATLKLYSCISTYLFEQECNELNGNSSARDALIKANKALADIIKKNV